MEPAERAGIGGIEPVSGHAPRFHSFHSWHICSTTTVKARIKASSSPGSSSTVYTTRDYGARGVGGGGMGVASRLNFAVPALMAFPARPKPNRA